MSRDHFQILYAHVVFFNNQGAHAHKCFCFVSWKMLNFTFWGEWENSPILFPIPPNIKYCLLKIKHALKMLNAEVVKSRKSL